MEEQIKQLIAEHMGIPVRQVSPWARIIEDLGADSLDTIEIIMALEEKFRIDIPDEHIEKCKTVKDVVELVAKLICGSEVK